MPQGIAPTPEMTLGNPLWLPDPGPAHRIKIPNHGLDLLNFPCGKIVWRENIKDQRLTAGK
jgi:hypothetical protein